MSDSQNAGVTRLERLLAQSRAHGERGLRQLHAVMRRDLEAARRRARQAEQRAREAERRADQAERRLANARSRAVRAEEKLAQVRASRTWKAGRLVTAVPRRVAKVIRKG